MNINDKLDEIEQRANDDPEGIWQLRDDGIAVFVSPAADVPALVKALRAVMEEVEMLRKAPDRHHVSSIYDEIADDLEAAITDALEGK